MKLESSAFAYGDMIPSLFTCEGRDISPELEWSDIPDHTKSLALICEDPDAPMGVFVHWVVFNIPPTMTKLIQGISSHELAKAGVKQGRTDFGKIGYGGPCPPSGTHRYYFKLYALDTDLSLPEGVSKDELFKAMKNNIISQTELMGMYHRRR